ncbi:Dynein heavy chain [Balamuthia mandrillaris]
MNGCVWLIVLVCGAVHVSALPGYFVPQATVQNLDCPSHEPCGDLFSELSSGHFDEYVLAGGTYNFGFPVVFSKSVTIRKWTERGANEPDPVLVGDIGATSEGCFNVSDEALPAGSSFSFNGIVVECTGTAFHFVSYQMMSLDLSGVTIRNSDGGLRVRSDGTEMLAQVTTRNVIIQNVSCELFHNKAMYLRNVNWEFMNVSFINNCAGRDMTITAVDYSIARSNGGLLLFQDHILGPGQGKLLSIYFSTFTTDHTTVEFSGNSAQTSVIVHGSAKWTATGPISFLQNSFSSGLLSIGDTAQMSSLIPLHLQGNSGDTFDSASSPQADVCVIPCDDDHLSICKCNDLPLLSFGTSSLGDLLSVLALPASRLSFSLPVLKMEGAEAYPSPDLQLPLRVHPQDGAFSYGADYTVYPSPSNTSDGSVRVVLNLPQGQNKALFIITKHPSSNKEGLITIEVDTATLLTYNSFSFFVSTDRMQLLMEPFPLELLMPNQTFQRENSTLGVSFPNENKPDHTLSQRDQHDRSVTARFVALVEVDAEGSVVKNISLQEIEFVASSSLDSTNNELVAWSALLTDLPTVVEIAVAFTLFAEERRINFAGVEQVMAANTLKWSLFLSSWPFQHHNHSLRLHLSLISQDGPILESVEGTDEKSGLWKLLLKTENTEIPINVLPLALLLAGEDEETTPVNVGWNVVEQVLIIELPFFEDASLLLDPDMSLLVTDAEDDGEEADDGLWWKIMVPVVVVLVVVVAVVVAVLGTGISRRRKQRRTEKLMVRMRSQTED